MKLLKENMKHRTPRPTNREYLWIWIVTLLFGVGFWLVDSLIHFFTYADHLRFMLFSPPDTYLDSLILDISNHTLFVRLAFLAGSIIGGSTLIRYLRSRDRLEKSLHQEQSFSSEIINRSPVIIHAVDPEGKTLLLNPRGEQILGYEKKNITGRPGWQYIRPELSAEEISLWLTRIEQQEITEEEFTVKALDGQEHICSWIHILQYNDTGTPAGIISMGRDITDQVMASRQINRLLRQQIALNQLALDLGETLDPIEVYRKLASYLKNLADCWVFLVSSFDHESELIRAEYILFNGVEQDLEELPLIPLDEEGSGSQSRVIRSGKYLYVPDFSAFNKKSKTNYTVSSDGSVVEGFGSTASDEPTTQSAIYVPMKVGGETMGVMQLQSPRADAYSETDIELLTAVANVASVSAQNARLYAELEVELNERNRIEKEIRKLNNELEERVRERTKELEGLNRELEDFAYIVSHDLKAPLRAVSQLTTWIQTDYQGFFDEEGRELLDLLTSRTNRMHNLIQGILDYSRVGRIQPVPQPVNLNKILKEVLDNLNPPSSIHIEIPSSLPTIHSSETHMTQVFQNLLDNSIKFMDKAKGRITIKCSKKDSFWHFSIQDNGPGIEEKYHDRIFKIFQTLKPRDQLENTGIGLAIVKKIIEKNGGTIRVESQSSTGTTFFFTIPIQEPEYAQ